MSTFGKYVLGIVPFVIAADAAKFLQRQNTRLLHRTDGLDAIAAYLDNKPDPDDDCNLTGCTSNSIDSTCKKLSCRAEDEDCDGDYKSGECKDIKELHEKGMCELADSDCGETLPKDPRPECLRWWDYRCRLGPAAGAVADQRHRARSSSDSDQLAVPDEAPVEA